MPKFVASGKFQPSALDALVAKHDGAVVKASQMFDVNRVISAEEGVIGALEAAYATDGALDDPTATLFGQRISTPEATAQQYAPAIYIPFTAPTASPVNYGTWTPSTLSAGAGITAAAAAGILTPAYPARTAFNNSVASTGWRLGTETAYAFAPSGSFSVAMWVRLPTIAAAHYVAARYNTSGEGWRLFITNAGALTFSRATGGTISAAVSSNGVVVANTPAHIGMTYDGTLNRSRLFVNGLLVKTTIHTSVPAVSAVAGLNMAVSAYSQSTSGGLIGDYSDFLLWDKAIPDHHFRTLWATGMYTDA